MKIISLAVAACLSLVLGMSNPILATVLEKKSFEDLALEAEMITISRVVKVESHPTRDNQYAYTYVEVGDLELLKGNYSQPTITLRMDGGPLGDGTALIIPGIPSFQPGEKVVLFVKGNGLSICPLVGWEQGLLRVVEEKRSGQETLRTSRGLRIHTIKNGEFVVSSEFNSNEVKASPGVPDYGEVKDLTRLEETEADTDLTLERLKSEINAILTQAGPKALPKEEVKSAEIKLDSPGPLTGKKAGRRN